MPREGIAKGDGAEPSAVAKMIREERHSAGLSQTALGERCGMGQGRISGIECGRSAPSLDALERLARAFDKELVVRFE